jgi:hypothetical protein
LATIRYLQAGFLSQAWDLKVKSELLTPLEWAMAMVARSMSLEFASVVRYLKDHQLVMLVVVLVEVTYLSAQDLKAVRRERRGDVGGRACPALPVVLVEGLAVDGVGAEAEAGGHLDLADLAELGDVDGGGGGAEDGHQLGPAGALLVVEEAQRGRRSARPTLGADDVADVPGGAEPGHQLDGDVGAEPGHALWGGDALLVVEDLDLEGTCCLRCVPSASGLKLKLLRSRVSFGALLLPCKVASTRPSGWLAGLAGWRGTHVAAALEIVVVE